MFKLYDSNNNFLRIVDSEYHSVKIETSLETGLKTLFFRVPVAADYLKYIQEEGYIETSDYRYVIKEVNFNNLSYIEVYCGADIEELKFGLIPVCDIINLNIEGALNKILNYIQSSWTIEYNSSFKNVTEYQLLQKTAYEILEQIRADFELDFFYDTKNKILKVYNKIGKDKGSYFSNELNLSLLVRQGQSYDLCTVLYPIGKDGLTIGSINNNINFIENYQYTNKYLPKYWIQEDIEEAQELKAAAEAYLSYYSSPIVGYSLKLNKLDGSIGIGDTITIVDKNKKIRQKQRVVRIVQYPFEPENDKVELSNKLVNFAQTMKRYNTKYDNQIAYIKANLATLQ